LPATFLLSIYPFYYIDMLMLTADQGVGSKLSNEAKVVAPQRAKAISQTLRLLGAVEAKSLWSCLWLNYKQVRAIEVGGRH
jgi:hypothetical protein